jgi:hypothetical protein
MWGLGGRALCLALALAAFAVPPAVAAEAEDPPETEPPVQLTIETDLAAPIEESSRVFLRLPVKGNEGRLQRLRATRMEFSRDYHHALATALSSEGILSFEHARSLIFSSVGLPRVRVSAGTATIELRTFWPSIWEGAGGASGEIGLTPIYVPASGRLEVVLHTANGNPPAAVPLPTEDDGAGNLRWVFGPESVADVWVRLGDPPPDDYFTKSMVSFLGDGLPFLLLLLLSWRLRGPSPSSTLARLGVSGLVLTLAGVAYFAYFDAGEGPDDPLTRFLRAGIPIVGVVAFVALAWRRRRIQLLAGIVTGLVGFGFAALLLPKAALVTEFDLTHIERDAGEIIGACALGTLLLALALIAFWRWLADLLPARREQRRGWQRMALAAVLLLVTGGVMGQLLLAADAQSFRDGFIDGEPGWAAYLSHLLEGLPFVVANLSRNLALLLVGAGLAVWLWARVGEGELAFSGREAAAFALLFATAVIGLGGEIKGYSIPLSFLLALPGIFLGTSLLARTPRVKIACSATTRSSSGELLERATQLARMRRRRGALGEAAVSAGADVAEHQRQLAEIEAHRRTLLAAPAMAPVAIEDRPRELLAFGLAGGAGARWRFRTLIERGWLIVAAPMAYTAFVLIDQRGAGAADAEEPFGLAFFAVALVNQMLIWPIAAWCFVLAMPLLPGRIGPLKGLIAGPLVALPPALASVFLDDAPGPEEWLFISAELTLMFVLVGLLLDFRSVRSRSGDLRQLGELYSITNVRAAVAYLAPLALLLFSVIQGLASGSGASALGELVSNAGSLLPSSGAGN